MSHVYTGQLQAALLRARRLVALQKNQALRSPTLPRSLRRFLAPIFLKSGATSCVSPHTLLKGFSSEYAKRPFQCAQILSSLSGTHRRQSNCYLRPSSLMKAPRGFEPFFNVSSEEEASEKTSRKKKPRSPPPEFWNPLLLITALTLWNAIPYAWRSFSDYSANEINFQIFVNELLLKGYVDHLIIDSKERVTVILNSTVPIDKLPVKSGHFHFTLGNLAQFEQQLQHIQKEVMGKEPQDFLPIQHVRKRDYVATGLNHLPTICLCLLGLALLTRVSAVGNSMHDPSRVLRSKRTNPIDSKLFKGAVKFSDVAGMQEAKHEVQEFVEFLKDPHKFAHLGAQIPKGALLIGAPGIGKTLLARAVAGEADVPFFSISGSDFIEVFVGVGPSRVRDLFDQARKHAPSIIFIDEIDAVGRKRNRGGFASGANDERENTLNQMLVEMDGFSPSEGVIVLAGTNRADILDPALTRPGRFDRTIEISPPDLSERAKIFQVYLKPLKIHKDLEPEELAKRLAALTPGFVGADIRNVCNEAAIIAARRNASSVELIDFEHAAERVLGGVKRSANFISDSVRKTVAYHEAGHTIAGWFLEHSDPTLKVSIVPRSNGALGFAQNLPDEVQVLTVAQIKDKIGVLLGGRVSEELIFNQASTGASDDLDKITKLAYACVSAWGFNRKVGLISFQWKGGDDQLSLNQKPYSENLAKAIDAEVQELIQTEYTRIKALLASKLDLLHSLANVLLQRETVNYHDLVVILGERPHPVSKAYSEYVAASLNPSPSHSVTDVAPKPGSTTGGEHVPAA